MKEKTRTTRKFRIERTEIITRVWEIEAQTEDEALENYVNEDPIAEQERESGHPDVRITEIS